MFKLQFSYQPGLSVNQILAFEMAGQVWSHFLQDDITVDIHVSVTDQLPDSVLAGAIPNYQSIDLYTVQLALQNDITSEEDAAAVDALGVDGILSGFLGRASHQGNTVTLTQAQAAALGIAASGRQSGSEGYIVLNSLRKSPLKWSYDFAREGQPESNSLDILSVALHEIGHILGFVSGIDAPTKLAISEQLAQTTILDLFRYSDRSRISGANELTRGATAYFSINGGKTNLAPFSSGILPLGDYTQGYQASHWGVSSVNASGIEVAADTAPIIQFINTMTQLAAPVDSESWVDSVEQLLAYANGGAVDANVQVVLGDNGKNLGVLDPTLAAKERSGISALDLIAFDVIGYDIRESATLDLSYNKLLADAKEIVSESLGLEAEDLEKAIQKRATIWGRNRLWEVLSAINRSEVYERRRRRRRVTRSASFWQEEDIQLDDLQIISGGGGNEAEFVVESGGTWVTQVQASPRSPLTLNTVGTLGSNHNDLIITPNQQVIDQQGHNTVYLGRDGGHISTGLGNDIVYSNGGNTTVQDEGGDNVILLQGHGGTAVRGGLSTHEIETGSGNDVIEFVGNRVEVHSGAGNDQIFGRNVNQGLRLSSSFLITALGGDNVIKLDGDLNQGFLIATGEGDDHVDLVGKSATLSLGDGDNQLLLKATSSTEVQTGKGNDQLNLDGGATGRHQVSLGNGNNQLWGIGATATITSGTGNDIVHLATVNQSTQGQFSVTSTGGNNVIQLGGGSESVHTVVTGTGNDVVEARSGQVTLETGDGNDLIVLGDSENVYFDDSGLLDYLLVTDLGEQDRVLLHGNYQDYSVGANHLFHKGELIAKFEGGVSFDLESDRVFFTDSTQAKLPKYLKKGLSKLENPDMIAPIEAIAPPSREDILLDAQLRFLETEAITYRIVSGVDAKLFQVDKNTGDLSFKENIDANRPQDANQDGIYEVRVRAVQGGGQTEKVLDSQLLYVRPETLAMHSQLNLLEGNDLDNSLVGTADGEVIHGRSGKDVLQAEGGNDQLFGGAGNDALFGGAGNDTLFGSNFIRRGSQEIDHYIEGGLGQDLFVLGDTNGSYYATAKGSDFMQIADFEVGTDQVSLYGNQLDYRFETEEGSTWLYYLDDAIAVFDQRPNLTWNDLIGNQRVIFDLAALSAEDPETTSSDSLDTPLASAVSMADQTRAFDNILNGTAETDTLDGGAGQDILRGRQGSDYLVGGIGNDTLFGQDGSDTLIGSSTIDTRRPEKDVLFGGKGKDLFVLGDKQSVYYTQYRLKDQALIKDFSVSQDRIRLKGSAADYQLKSAGAHLMLLHEGDRLALLNNVSSLTLNSSAFEYV